MESRTISRISGEVRAGVLNFYAPGTFEENMPGDRALVAGKSTQRCRRLIHRKSRDCVISVPSMRVRSTSFCATTWVTSPSFCNMP